jgi:ribosomal protein S18 acetylase RimI-like enzyme
MLRAPHVLVAGGTEHRHRTPTSSRRAGLVTYASRGDELEIVTIHVDQEGRGVGRALMDAVVSRARHDGVRRIWLTTTNDNLRAVAFYQRWGMDLVAVIRDGIERAHSGASASMVEC